MVSSNKAKKKKGFSSGRVKASDGVSRKTLGRETQRAQNLLETQRWADRWRSMTTRERREFTKWSRARDIPMDDGDPVWEDYRPEGESEDESRMEGVLRGDEQLELSHEGEEYGNLIGEMSDDILNLLLRTKAISKKDRRTRKDRTQKRTDLFAGQMTQLVAAFAHWDATRDATGYECLDVESPDGEVRAEKVWVVDIFRSYYAEVPTSAADEHAATAFVKLGLIPCAPLRPRKVVTVRTLEFYRRARNRCPRYSMQAFCGTLSDFQEMPARRYLTQQMSICFDLLVSLREGVDALVQKALHRDTPNWRLVNACAPCFYKIKDEPHMDISVLLAMDGNNSLSRVKSVKPQDAAAEGPAEVNERIDWRDGRGDYILHPAKVDMWADATDPAKKWEGNGEPEESGCEERWHNMTHDVSSRMWGIYEETGVFLAVCRHGMTVLITDMLRSGELSKYPLALVYELLQVIEDMEDMWFGYDIGCRFKKTVAKSRMGDEARKRRLKFACGLFHGHAHSRMCQLWNLGTYIDGMGLEDLEICERVFSKSNSLATIVRHASTFHRHQAIRTYFKHMDEVETFQGVSIFLFNNVKQALNIINKHPLFIQEMSQLGVQDTKEFYGWLGEERAYLMSLKKEPAEETLKMEYVKALGKLEELEEQRSQYLSNVGAPTLETNTPKEVAAYERRRRYAVKKHLDKQEEIAHLEEKMNIAQTWGKGSAERKEVEEMLRTREYRLDIDKLEELVVSRIFELTKMNMSQTGYKLRKHIAKALQTRSKAVKRALQRYNDAARCLRPMGRLLEWEEVVSYSFLGQFDLLRDARQDVREKPWATPAGRHTMDLFFKNLRADEEITRCTLEARRLLTYMRDEERYLKAAYLFHRDENPDVAYQIRRRLAYRKRLHEEHRQRIESIRRLPGYDGSKLVVGERAGQRAGFDVRVFNRPALSETTAPPADSTFADEPKAPIVDLGEDYDSDVDSEFDWEYEGEEENDEEEMEALESAFVVAGILEDANIKTPSRVQDSTM